MQYVRHKGKGTKRTRGGVGTIAGRPLVILIRAIGEAIGLFCLYSLYIFCLYVKT